MLFIVSMLYLQHFLLELGLGSSVGKALKSLLVLELTTFQMGNLEEHLVSIGWNLIMEGLEDGLSWVRVIYQLSYILL